MSGTIVAVRTKDVPENRRVEGTRSGYRCALCSEDCILSPTTQLLRDHFGDTVIVCFNCWSTAKEA